MGARTKARRRAVEILYEADIRGIEVGTIAEQRVADRPLGEGSYALRAATGVASLQPELDAELADCAEGWDLERMPVVDRNLLRLAAWELRSGIVPAAVVIDEAVELARQLSTDDSPRFVNGILARLAALQAERAEEPQS